MPKILKFSLFVFVVAIVSLISVNQAQAAAKIRFTDNVQLDFTNVPATVYIASSSECDSLTVSTSTLNADVPAGSTFTLKTANYTVLGLTPSGGTTTLAFDTSYFSAGYVSQWIASSSVATATVSFSLSVSAADTYYLIKVDGVDLSYNKSSSDKLISFSYTGGFSAKTFTITQETPWWALPGPGAVTAPADVTPPAISQVTVTVGENQATISWKTDESSISWILYGTTTDYGLERKTTTYLTSHSLTLTNLSASTTYHYQVKSKDSVGNIGSSTDQTFTTLALGEKPISGMTIEELKAEIARITALIAQLQAQLAEPLAKPAIIPGIPTDFRFEKTLRYGQVLIDVKYLQIVLNSDPETRLAVTGVGSPGRETNIFGPLTKAAVIKFQEKYTSEILAPWELTKGTGIVGKTTQAKLNLILGI